MCKIAGFTALTAQNIPQDLLGSSEQEVPEILWNVLKLSLSHTQNVPVENVEDCPTRKHSG